MVSDICLVKDLAMQMSEITSVFAMEAGLHILYNTCEAVRYEDTLERARVPPDLFGPLYVMEHASVTQSVL